MAFATKGPVFFGGVTKRGLFGHNTVISMD